MTRLRPLRNEATARLAESVLHLQARKRTEDATGITRLDRVKAKAAEVEGCTVEMEHIAGEVRDLLAAYPMPGWAAPA